MNMPGFTTEASLCKTSENYFQRSISDTAKNDEMIK